MNSCAPEGLVVPALPLSQVVLLLNDTNIIMTFHRVPQSIVFYVVFCMLMYVLSSLVFVLFVLQFNASYYSFGIIKPFFV
jgi:hypothetical protein